ncbi:hypothetical protein [Aquimarina rhabdastrellae]
MKEYQNNVLYYLGIDRNDFTHKILEKDQYYLALDHKIKELYYAGIPLSKAASLMLQKANTLLIHMLQQDAVA